MKPREKRSPVRLSARMLSDQGWRDVNIRNVSAHGMLLSAEEAPAPGSYLEVRRDTVRIVAQIVWRDGALFGVRTRDAIDLKSLIAPPKTLAAAETPGGERVERRRAPRGGEVARSRHVSRMLQYAALLAAVVMGATALVGAVAGALAPLRTIEARLADI